MKTVVETMVVVAALVESVFRSLDDRLLHWKNGLKNQLISI